MTLNDQLRLRREAGEHFTRAAAALFEHSALAQIQSDPEVFAWLEAGRGMLKLAQSDPDENVLDRVQAILQRPSA